MYNNKKKLLTQKSSKANPEHSACAADESLKLYNKKKKTFFPVC